MVELKRTPLFPLYEKYGGKTIEFGGWDMPVQFQGIIAEHEAVRNAAGLFDVSHMGEFEVSGPDAHTFLSRMVTNDLSKLAPGRAIYSPMCYDDGGTVDDLLVYCFSEDYFWVVVNAGNIEKDFLWMQQHIDQDNVSLSNVSDQTALLALQGPKAQSILSGLTDVSLDDIGYYRFVRGSVAGVSAVISRTGYTGEDGFELYLDAQHAQHVWDALLKQGGPEGLMPCGLGARDTLRLEAKLPLYGHELERDISPLEAGLSFAVKVDKGSFIGHDALAAQKAQGVKRKVVGIELLDRGIPRAGYEVWKDGRLVGIVTSGTMSPTLKRPIGLVLIDADCALIGMDVSVVVRGKQLAAQVVRTPFYQRQK